MTMRFFPTDRVQSLRAAARVESGCVHVWPMQFEGRKALRPVVREILGMYCGVAGAELELVEGEYGKPAFAPTQPFARSVSFNLTHSGKRALLAVSDGRDVGVDLEELDARTNALTLANRYFFGAEYDVIRGAPEPSRQLDYFFRFWAAKESVIKAQGIGLSAPLDRFCIQFDSSWQTASVSTFDVQRIDEGWFVRTLDAGPGWYAALTAKGRDWRVRILEWDAPIPPAADPAI